MHVSQFYFLAPKSPHVYQKIGRQNGNTYITYMYMYMYIYIYCFKIFGGLADIFETYFKTVLGGHSQQCLEDYVVLGIKSQAFIHKA